MTFEDWQTVLRVASLVWFVGLAVFMALKAERLEAKLRTARVYLRAIRDADPNGPQAAVSMNVIAEMTLSKIDDADGPDRKRWESHGKENA